MPAKRSLLKTPFVATAAPVRIGFIPVADCAPLLVARDLDFFRKHGVKVELSCEVGWATIREKLLYNQVDAAHAIAGLTLAMRMGVGMPPCRVIAPFLFNLHGNAVTLSRDLWNRGVRDAGSLRKLIRSTSRRLTFGVVSRYSSHHFLMRRWLATGRIDAEKDVRIVALPPMQMAANLAAGLIDGYCVGEPWNSAAVAKGSGWVVATSEQLAPLHPEKVLLIGEAFARQHSEQAAALTRALCDACAFCDTPENRKEVACLLANSGYFWGCEDILKKSLIGPFDLGTGQVIDASSFHIFHRHEANRLTDGRGQWLLNEFLNHGLLRPDQRAAATEAMRDCWMADLTPFPATTAAAKRRTHTPSTRPIPALA